MGNQKINIPPQLSAQDKASFAYKTIKDRLPVIIVKTIDFLHRQRKELHKFGGIKLDSPSDSELVEIENDAKDFVAQLTKLRKEVETNKPASLFAKIPNLNESDLEYFNDDIEQWNKALNDNKLNDGSLPRWFDSPWLLVECYMYRKIKEYALLTRHLKMFDPFVEQKQMACTSSLAQILIVANHLKQVERVINESTDHSHPNERNEFKLFVQLALWANKSDLSLSGMSADKVQSQQLLADIRESLEDLHENILCDNLSELWFKTQSIKNLIRSESNCNETKTIHIDLVADNSGYEIFVDLCLLHYLTLMFCPISLEKSGVKFRLHVKRLPWFVSDTLEQDIDWLLSYMSGQDETLKDIAEKWKYFFTTNLWQIHADRFWTLPYDYSEMPAVAKDLYETLKQSSLIIFKGDLNYRKLVGDRKWHTLTPFGVALRDFLPAPLVALRTTKADVVVGIEDINMFAKINNNELPRDWMISGEYGLIQYFDPL